MTRRFGWFPLLILSLLAVGSTSAPAGRDGDHPRAVTRDQTQQPTRRYDAWVTFRDKGLTTRETRDAALRELEQTFDRRALERRRQRRTLPGRFDDHDLPLGPAYVAGVRATGAEVRVQSRWLNGVSVVATRSQLDELAKLRFVGSVADVRARDEEPRNARVPVDRDLRTGPPRDPDPVYGWAGRQIRQLRLDVLHKAGYRGAGVRIAVVDTGFRLDHVAFQNAAHPLHVVGQWDFMDNDPTTTPEARDLVDQHEHGTLVLGTMAANWPGTLVGSAPEADFMLLKAEDAGPEYWLEERWFVAALEYAEAHGADVITSSLVLKEGYTPEQVDGKTSVMAQGWNLAVANGVIGVQGAGNSGHDADPATHHLMPPAGAPGVISVGAAAANGRAASFSSDGRSISGTVKPELLAWGQESATVSPYGGRATTSTSGTSMAAPLLAGAIACLLQKHPEWTVDEVRRALCESGSYFRRNGRPDPLFVEGFGVPDLAMAAGLAGSARSGLGVPSRR